jgi:hypothetical protein
MPKRRRGRTRNKEKCHDRSHDISSDPKYRKLGNKGKIKPSGCSSITPFSWSRQNVIKSRVEKQFALDDIRNHIYNGN